MKKVIIIANQFAPMGGSGVQRSIKFVKNLRNFGYEPIVFTREIDSCPLLDYSMLKEIPEDIKIIRTKAYELSEAPLIFKIIGKVLSKLLIPDSSVIWAKKSQKALINIIKKENIDIIYTTSAPYSAHLLGLKMKQTFKNIKWVADFRDEWTNNPYTLDNPHSFLRTKIEKNLERSVLKNSTYLITNTPIMMQNFISNNKDLSLNDKFCVIPNGYDDEDFKNLDLTPPKNEKFTMTYTGALYGRRKPDNLFLALKNLKASNKIDSTKIKLYLIGNYHEDRLKKQINSLGLNNEVKVIGYVPHKVCIDYQLNSDCLVLIEGSGTGANAFYTGKIFEYMKTNRPVIAILPDGVAKDLVLESKIGKVANTDNIAEIQNIILHYYNSGLNKDNNFFPDKSVIEKFERKKLTKKLAKIFDII